MLLLPRLGRWRSSAIAAAVAAVHAAALGANDGKAYTVKDDLDDKERTALRSSALTALSKPALVARIAKYHECARLKDYEQL